MRLTYLGSFVSVLQLAIRISLITAYSHPENGRKLLFRMHAHPRNVSRYFHSAYHYSAIECYCTKNN